MRFFKRTRGFSLIEVMAVLAVGFLLITLAMPSFSAFLKTTEDKTIQESVLKLLQFARSEALLKHEDIRVCPSEDLDHCSDRAEVHLIVIKEVGQVSSVLYSIQLAQGKMKWRGFPQDQFLQFLPSGETAQENGSFWYYPKEGKSSWSVSVSKAGRSKIVATNTI